MWEIDIKIDFKGIGCENVDWIYLDQDRDQWYALVSIVMNFMFHKRQEFLGCVAIIFSIRTLLQVVW
jgi:hypothetical protein